MLPLSASGKLSYPPTLRIDPGGVLSASPREGRERKAKQSSGLFAASSRRQSGRAEGVEPPMRPLSASGKLSYPPTLRVDPGGVLAAPPRECRGFGKVVWLVGGLSGATGIAYKK